MSAIKDLAGIVLGRLVVSRVIPALTGLKPGRYPHSVYGPLEIPGQNAGLPPFRLTTPGFFLAYGAILFYLGRRPPGGGIGDTQKELFPKLRRELRLKSEDVATSEDPVEACMERVYGWDLTRMRELRDSIGRKGTPDMFTKEEEPLTAAEAQLLEQIEDCLDRVAKQYGSLEAAGLSLAPCPLCEGAMEEK